MKTKLFSISAVSVAVMALVFASCNNPLATLSKQGSLSISIANNINARTLVPSIDMNAASFTVSASGPNGASFSRSATGGSITVDHLAFGSWNITVNALNSGGTVIGSGTATATVHTGETTTVDISVVPLSGSGSLDLTVGWTASQVETPSIAATLTPPSGTATTLNFSITGNEATYSSSTIPAGYQTLTLQLLDNSIPVYGAVEVVRIVAGQTTSGTYNFTNVNQPGGTLQVNITPALADPIPVSMSAVPSTFVSGTSETVTASVSDSTQNVVYLWYLNGVSVGTGASYTIPAATAAGYYRLDVTAYSADGTRGGSATTSFQVTASGGTTVYAGGSISQMPGYWENGTWVGLPLPTGAIYGLVYSLDVSGSGVYASGYVYDSSGEGIPGYWGNGTWVSLPLPNKAPYGYAIGLAVSGSTVYVGGNAGDTPGYWQNGAWTPLALPSGSNFGLVNSLLVSGSTIYAGGTVQSDTGAAPGYWKNGTWVALTAPGSTFGGQVRWLVASGGSTVYAGSYDLIGSGGYLPGYWQNGTWVSLPVPSGATNGASVSSLAISGSTVYAGGYGEISSPYNWFPGYWKNGTWIGLPLPSGNTFGKVSSLVVSGSTLYAGGYVAIDGSASPRPGYWQNGTWVPLPVPSGSWGVVYPLVVVGP